ncbi:MAG: hypothetical protein IT288_16425 [Bdellovibrionales bacterium]|nr:hypothetical protein [Bdellovibrionales bacterium]
MKTIILILAMAASSSAALAAGGVGTGNYRTLILGDRPTSEILKELDTNFAVEVPELQKDRSLWLKTMGMNQGEWSIAVGAGGTIIDVVNLRPEEMSTQVLNAAEVSRQRKRVMYFNW